MKKLILLFVFIANYCTAQVGDKVFFVDKNNEYSVLLKPLVKISYDTLQGTIPVTNMVFLNPVDTSFKYNLMILIVDSAAGNTAEGYITDAYSGTFSSTCKCTVVESKKVAYPNFKAYRFIYTRNTYKGYYSFVVVGNSIYTLNTLFKEADFDKHKDEYNNMLNTLVFNQ
jgi:hypothetical protein